MKKILVITPKFPIPTTGACEQERLAGILQLQRLGWEVRIVARAFNWQDKNEINQWSKDSGIAVDLVDYEFIKNKNWRAKIKRIMQPKYWDGAAYEYGLPAMQSAVARLVEEFQPDIAWFDYTYLWPLYKIFQKKKIPIVTRSINFEPTHFLQEDGISFLNILKFLPKFLSELKVIGQSDYLFAITPKEEQLYRKLGAKNIATLPLRSLPLLLADKREIVDKKVLHLFFMGASYNVHHSRKAAEFIIKKIAPAVTRKAPGKFIFHLVGKKLPSDLARLCVGNIKVEGFIENLAEFLNKIDIALVPSLMGAGMQQKIFEPLCLGIPTVTSPRGLVGYSFQDEEHLLLAKTKGEFVEQILRLQDGELKKKLSRRAMRQSRELFSQNKLNEIIQHGLNNIL